MFFLIWERREEEKEGVWQNKLKKWGIYRVCITNWDLRVKKNKEGRSGEGGKKRREVLF
jgi:hypothetical protein